MLKNLQSKLLTLLVLSTVLPVSAVGIYGISSSTQALTDLNVSQIQNEVEQEAFRIEHTLEDAHGDVLFLSKMPSIRGIVQARESNDVDRTKSNGLIYYTSYEDWVRRAETIFKTMMASKKNYKTIQYLDEQGNELVRVDTDRYSTLLHSAKKLGNKANAIYFQPTTKLKLGQIYVSPVLLEQPSTSAYPTEAIIYYATPIYSETGKLRGAIVITLYVKSLTHHLKSESESYQGIKILATKEGNYLSHTDHSKIWSGLPKQANNLKADYSEAIRQRILSSNEGDFETDAGRIISYRTMNQGLNHQMLIMYDLPKYTVLQSVSHLKRISFAVIVLSLGTVLAIGSSIVRRISKTQSDLYHQAQMAAETAEQKASELKQTLHELHHTQTQLVQTEKMSSLGQLVAGVANEINNPVNFIYGNLSHVNEYSQDLLHIIRLYQQYYPNPDRSLQAEVEDIDLDFLMADMPKMLESMKVGADRIRQIVLSLRNFSRIDESEMKAVDIHEGIDSTLLILQNRTKANGDFPGVEIVQHYDKLPLVECYAGQLNQVFMNILSNAIDALEETVVSRHNSEWQPQITISTEYLPSEKLLSPNTCSLIPAVCIRIADNGTGIPSKIRERLFEPFFTTKSIGKGTGLGLSISYQIVTERHNGKLDCFSEPGKGTEFVIEIPVRQVVDSTTRLTPTDPHPVSVS
ncbi:MAG: ATP-binding protein [Leptolyngbyaceae cyanobacterium bins.302]|nr:ATP-binding protein [Leptolyngbyaceae cyanobacterium bins.302]